MHTCDHNLLFELLNHLDMLEFALYRLAGFACTVVAIWRLKFAK